METPKTLLAAVPKEVVDAKIAANKAAKKLRRKK